MFFLFGWGRSTLKNYGITFKQLCTNCNNEGYWQLYKQTLWFTLFFIPVIPYETKYLLLCPVCEKGVALKYSDAQPLITLAEANTELINERITLDEYKKRVGVLNEKETYNEEKLIEGDVEVGDKKIKKQTKPSSHFCVHCGKPANNDDNFCQNCGKKIN